MSPRLPQEAHLTAWSRRCTRANKNGRHLKASEANRVRTELLALADEWGRVLVEDPAHARPIVTALLNGRITITPATTKAQWTLSGEGTLAGLFTRRISEEFDFPLGWRARGDLSKVARSNSQGLLPELKSVAASGRPSAHGSLVKLFD
jgi:hypothetical protein